MWSGVCQFLSRAFTSAECFSNTWTASCEEKTASRFTLFGYANLCLVACMTENQGKIHIPHCRRPQLGAGEWATCYLWHLLLHLEVKKQRLFKLVWFCCIWCNVSTRRYSTVFEETKLEKFRKGWKGCRDILNISSYCMQRNDCLYSTLLLKGAIMYLYTHTHALALIIHHYLEFRKEKKEKAVCHVLPALGRSIIFLTFHILRAWLIYFLWLKTVR